MRHLQVTLCHCSLSDERRRGRDAEQVLLQAPAHLRSSFDLDADQLGIAADVKVVVLDVAQAVGEVDHVAVGKLDVKLFHVEVDVALKGEARL